MIVSPEKVLDRIEVFFDIKSIKRALIPNLRRVGLKAWKMFCLIET